MKRRSPVRSIGLLAAALLPCAQTFASVDTTPKPGGVYRLKPGTYVAEGSSCSRPPDAAIRRYDGRGISTTGTRACRARVISRKGYVYRSEQSCIAAGFGTGRRSLERQTVDVRDALHFGIGTHTGFDRYRYCPTYQLPADLQRPAR